ncbi:amidohydrolase family protein [Rhodococcus fascians]|uniref:amidohydrolase n=1 Tax=Rhodococcoides fascians TaxID=1828 RepID=UPI0019621F14|nr:amidohydrolase family protein [Rhodococcus fascians]MBM7244805.1 amidohydrolase family protein [Rhodococcus fascians]MBY3810738.1 amidohydrolase family protein [Rhodococcus fascians]MBY3842349.1 amidohydrolase family protein [Rhodococcus fascians]MBY3846927.1 amidohydrolase family protein [Rhodococcus fascians]MBY3852398.1 amidohydrolase family protein [Rhodococcus fascians]
MIIANVALDDSGVLFDIELVGSTIGSITPAGSDRTRGVEVVDGAGGVALPGFVDSHVHLTQWAAARRRIDVGPASSAADAVALVFPYARTAGDSVVRANGFRDAQWPDEPHKDLLENALPGVRVALTSMDLHTLWLSPALLRDLGIDHPTGVLRDVDGLEAVMALEALEDPAELDRAVLDATAALAVRGVTGVVDFEFADNRTVWDRRLSAGSPAVRVDTTVWPQWLDEALDRGERTGDVSAVSDMIRRGPLKVMLDGSLNTRTACCHDRYPGVDGDNAYGLLLETHDGLYELVSRAARGGITSAVHAIGDRANGVALDAFERAGCGGRIEHAQQLVPEDIARFAALGVAASVQPQHAMADRDIAEDLWAGRRSVAYGYGSLHRSGATLLFGSDAPVSPPEPLAGVAAAVFRTDDDRPPWRAEESVPLDAALQAASGGRAALRVGDVADIVVLEEHPAHRSVHDLAETEIRATVCAGTLTHAAAV